MGKIPNTTSFCTTKLLIIIQINEMKHCKIFTTKYYHKSEKVKLAVLTVPRKIGELECDIN